MPRPSPRCRRTPASRRSFATSSRTPICRTETRRPYAPFLKIIDEFDYDHSERLGDAFEYLLSVLGSQGDAGQFRTPRHIIDFIVAVIDRRRPKRCSTLPAAPPGFDLVLRSTSSKANTDAHGHSTLTPDDRGGNPNWLHLARHGAPVAGVTWPQGKLRCAVKARAFNAPVLVSVK